MDALLICGSRNPEGQTARAAGAVMEGLAKAGASTHQAFLPELAIDRCRQCDERGWGMCRKEGCCVIEDDIGDLVDKMSGADVVVFATPVYFSDLSESLRALLDRLRRTCTNEAGKAKVEGKPAMGVCVAGGGGGGAPQCCVSLQRVLSTCGFDVADMVPIRRQNLETKLEQLETAGYWLATEAVTDA
jgi:multimeric flavodoxin WrbA